MNAAKTFFWASLGILVLAIGASVVFATMNADKLTKAAIKDGGAPAPCNCGGATA